MDHQRLKMKIGVHEFEAEGPPDVVQAQFEAFKEMVTAMPSAGPAPSTPGEPSAPEQAKGDSASTDSLLDKIMRVDGRIVSLTVRAQSIDDAIILLIYGQKTLLDNEAVTGGQIMEGLKVSGQAVIRVDRQLERAGREGDVIVIGQHRSKTYRMTNKGLSRAREIAKELVSIVA